jgi:hypothetical protein
VIVGVEVTNAGTDSEQLPPMLDQLDARYQRMPDDALVDGGFATVDTIEQADQRGCTMYAPLKDEEKQRKAGKDPHARKPGDSDAVAQWRSRMGTESRRLYRLRCQTAGGMGQRPMPQSGVLVHSRTRPTSLPDRGLALCHCTQSGGRGETALGGGDGSELSADRRKGGKIGRSHRIRRTESHRSDERESHRRKTDGQGEPSRTDIRDPQARRKNHDLSA